MNATQFVVLLLIGVLFANVGARQLEGESEDTKLSISLPKTTTKGVGAELSSVSSTGTYNSEYGTAEASGGRGRPNATAYGSHYKYTNGFSYSNGTKESATKSESGASGRAGAQAGAGSKDSYASGGGKGNGGSKTSAKSRGGR